MSSEPKPYDDSPTPSKWNAQTSDSHAQTSASSASRNPYTHSQQSAFSAAIAREIIDGVNGARARGLACDLPTDFTIETGSGAPQTVKITD